MSLLSAFLDALGGDPPKPKPILPATAAEFPDNEVSRAFMEAIRDRRKFRVERDAFRRELRNRGMTDTALARLVEMYERGLRANANLKVHG